MRGRGVSRRALLYGTPVAVGGAAFAPGDPAMAAAATVAASTASPRDYGAVGDGVTDDTAAVQACLASNLAVDFGGPESTYLITETLIVGASTPQVLTARGATIRAGAGVNMMRFRGAGHTVCGLVFDGTGQSTGLGLIVEGSAAGSVVDGCTFTNVPACAVSIQPGAHRTKVTGCTMRHCGHGTVDSPWNCTVFVADADFCAVVDNDLLECDWGVYFRGALESPGIRYYTCQGNTITCASPAPAAAQGISCHYGRDASLAGNTVVGFDDNCIDCWGCQRLSIAGNNTSGGRNGVFVGDAPTGSITITGNTFNGPRVGGVRVDSSTGTALIIGVVVTGNTIVSPGEYGIQVSKDKSAQTTGITVADNDLQLNSVALVGIRLTNIEASRVSGNRVYRPRKEGIVMTGVDVVEVSGNFLQDASHPEPDTYNAVHVSGCNRVLLRDNTAYGSARHAIEIVGGTGMTVTGTRWRALGTGGVQAPTAGNVLADNVAL